jgi:hypothetical protein
MQVTEPVAIPFLPRETWEFLKSFIDLKLKQLLFLQAIATLATLSLNRIILKQSLHFSSLPSMSSS